MIEFLIFAIVLIGIAFFHNKTLEIALSGALILILFKILNQSDFDLILHLEHEWHILLNLAGLLLGFELLAQHFRKSQIPALLPNYLPDGWTGGFALIVSTFLLSSFLDNIAGAIIGGTVAGVVFKNRLHIGYIAAIVAASNAGGAGSVLGDTTTTMMWIAGISSWDVLHAFIGSGVAILFFGIIASNQQHKFQPISKDAPANINLKAKHLIVVVLILIGALVANLLLDFPAIGVWAALICSIAFCKTEWSELKHASRGTFFLLALVLSASLLPVENLPTPSWYSTFGLGLLSAVFDNIPLTKLALDQGGYDWGMLAFAVGYGGSITWFGSSAGVALSNLYPESRSVFNWLKCGWHVVVGYILGFFALYWTLGWNPI